MEPFIYHSKQFQTKLRDQPHAAGEIEYLRSVVRPGACVLDVGANRGVVTVALADSVGPAGCVYAFEPVPEYYDALRGNLSRNRATNAEAFQLALSDHEQRLRFYKRGESSGITPGENAETLRVKATTIERFLAERDGDGVDLLSMDCEGSELRVLRGARSLLAEQGPRIFCEIHHSYLESLGESAGDVVVYLESLGYRVRPLSVEALGTKPTLEECSHIYAEKPT